MKRFLSFILVAVMCLSLVSVAGAETAAYSVGVCFTDLTNPIFAECGDILTKKGVEMGWDVVVLDCQNVAATQITQVENLIEKQVDVIVIYPVEVAALEDVCQKASDAGIKIMSWDQELACTNTSFLVKNYDVGTAIGTAAADWINAHYPEGCEYAVFGVYTIPVVLERTNGIKDTLAKLAPTSTMVVEDQALDAATGMEMAETMLQAHPEIKVFACIGDGAGIGANEALKASGANLEEYGIFCCDASEEALAAIYNKEAIRATISLGSAADFAETVFKAVETMMTQADYEKDIYKVSTPVTEDNLAEFYTAK
ncbi:MAG: sugar ABC transporter substrate-binding protein [Eubacteriales bacterium]|nr:sugar ABC transporter substrate-binding protein [Eubacteriales bacterium]